LYTPLLRILILIWRRVQASSLGFTSICKVQVVDLIQF